MGNARRGLELYFASSPEVRVCRKLQLNGWWWSAANNCWCNLNNKVNRKYAEDTARRYRAQIAIVAADRAVYYWIWAERTCQSGIWFGCIKSFIERSDRYGKGFGRSNVFYMRKMYLTYPELTLYNNPEEIKYLSKTQALSTRAVIAEDNRLEKEDIEIVKME